MPSTFFVLALFIMLLSFSDIAREELLQILESIVIVVLVAVVVEGEEEGGEEEENDDDDDDDGDKREISAS